MRKPPRRTGAERPAPDEIAGLERALDRAYARLRERARTDWLCTKDNVSDPADAAVSVTISATENSPSRVAPARRFLSAKAAKPRRKIPRNKRRRPSR